MKRTKQKEYPFGQIGRWVRESLKALNLTQELVHTASGIRRGTFYALLKGGMSA